MTNPFLTGDAYAETLPLRQARDEVVRLRARLNSLEENEKLRKKVLNDAIAETQSYRKRIDELELQLGVSR